MFGEKGSTQTVQVRLDRRNETFSIKGDVCVVGAGVAGLTAAVEAARLGLKVILLDSSPHLGGQAYNSIIGTFCGFYSNGPDSHLLTKGLAEEMLTELRAAGGLFDQPPGETIIPIYDEVKFLRWAEGKVQAAGVTPILGASVIAVNREGARLLSLEAATRYGILHVEADSFIDASGEAVLAWLAGAACNISGEHKVKSSLMFSLEDVDYSGPYPSDGAVVAALQEKADDYGLPRKKGLVFHVPEKNIAICNMTHVETPLDPFVASRTVIEGKDQADRVLQFLKDMFPATFAKAKVRSYAATGVRQARWISAVKQLTLDEIRAGTLFEDAVARTAWPVELHQGNGYIWESFPEDHVHYVPLRSMLSPELENYVAAGRCIDGDLPALSSVRVMGPCMAEGDAAAKAVFLAGRENIHKIAVNQLQEMVSYNLKD
ncbi:MAG: FAD-dependent oxidoreductase [Clostridiales bacterium]|nr:FAD-dependent oxidoreductase [Clostridiales bacterium]